MSAPRVVSRVLLFLALLVLAAYSCLSLRWGDAPRAVQRFTVLLQNEGVSAREMEETITAPLENRIGELPGIKRLESQTEQGQTKVFLSLQPGIDSKVFFLDLRDRVERVYAQLPSTVQRPQIFQGDTAQAPVFIVAFQSNGIPLEDLREEVERRLKPLVQKIPGTGQIEVGGGGLKEIQIRLDADVAGATGLQTGGLSGFLQANHQQIPAGDLPSGKFSVPVTVSGRFPDLGALRSASVVWKDGRQVKLGDIASISVGVRPPEILSRVDGEARVVLYVSKTDAANGITLGSAVRQTVLAATPTSWHPLVLHDEAELLGGQLFEVAAALSVGLLLATLVLVFFVSDGRALFLLAGATPVTLFLTLGVAAALGIVVDRSFLAGLTVGVGLLTDTAFILYRQYQGQGISAARTLRAPLIASALTTVVVFLPLFGLDEMVPGIGALSFAVTLTLTIGTLLTQVFLVPFLDGWKVRREPRKWIPARVVFRPAALLTRFSLQKGRTITGLLWGIPIALAALLLFLPKNLLSSDAEPVIHGQVEFPSGTSIPAVDETASAILARLKGMPGVRHVEFSSRRASAPFTVTLEKNAERGPIVAALESQRQSDGFVYIPAEDRGAVPVELTLLGPDDKTLKGLAKTWAARFAKESWVQGTVLHFKEDPPVINFRPRGAYLASHGLRASQVGETLRSAVQGPVSLKWIEDHREWDLRIFGTREMVTTTSLAQIGLLDQQNQTVRLSQAGAFASDTASSQISHLNRQRAVFFSLQAAPLGLEELREKIQVVAASQALPDRYLFLPDASLAERSQFYLASMISLAGALALVFVILVLLFEGFRTPWVVLSTLPGTFLLPLIAITLGEGKISLNEVIGFIVLSGMAVNNAIVIAEEYARGARTRWRLWHVLRQRCVPLVVTTATAALSCVPLLFTGQGASLSASLGGIVALGSLGSLISTYLFLPHLLLGKTTLQGAKQ